MKKIKLILVKKIKTSKLLSWIRDLNILLTLSDAHTSISKETKGEKEKEKKKRSQSQWLFDLNYKFKEIYVKNTWEFILTASLAIYSLPGIVMCV